METGPHPLAERLVARLLPPACREHVLGDLYERNTTTGRYVWDALRAVPFALWGQVRRTTSPGLAGLHAGAVYGGFISAYGRVAPAMLQTSDGVLGTVMPALTAVAVLALRDAWTGRPRTSVRALVDVPLCVAMAGAAHVLAQAMRPQPLVDATVTGLASVVSLVLLSLVRAAGAQARTPLLAIRSGGSDMQAPHSANSIRRRSKVWLVALVPLGAAVGLGASYLSPPVYRAAVSVLVLAPDVPPHMMPVDLRPRLTERLNAISMQVLSSSQLERVVQDLRLYEREPHQPADEGVVARLRQDLSLNVVASSERGFWFSVAYRATDPKVAVRVAERLASLFVQHNLEDAERAFDQANVAVQLRLEDVGTRLAAASAELNRARRGEAGARPVAVVEIEHQVIRDQYRSLFESAQRARTGQDLTRRSIGEQFRILEPARLPERPIEPIRPFWSALGAAVGLIVACAALLIQRRPSPPSGHPEPAALHA